MKTTARHLIILQASVLAGLVLCIVLLSLVPPVSRDALIHHLTVPKIYLRHGVLHEIPFMFYSYFPMNVTLLYMIPLAFGNDIAPKFIHFSFAVATASLIYLYLRERVGKGYALFAVLLFLSVPIIIKLSITVYVDLGLAFFTFGGVYALLKWMEDEFRLRYLFVAALCCGLALGTKYSGLIVFFLLTLFTPFLYSRCMKERAETITLLRNTFIFTFVALLTFSPWMARNYIWKGNPIYPLYDGFFNPPANTAQETTGSLADGEEADTPPEINHFTYRAIKYGEPTWYILLLPLRIFFEGEDFSPDKFDGRMTPALLILPSFAFIRPAYDTLQVRREKKALMAFSVFFLLFVLFTAVVRVRYFVPMVPCLAVLSAFGAKNLIEGIREYRGKTVRRRIAWGGLGCIMLYFTVIPVNYLHEQFQYIKPFGYLSGSVSRDEYITRLRPEYAAIQYINRQTPKDSRILFMFIGNRAYYCERDFLFEARDRKYSILKELLQEAKQPYDLYSGLKKLGITHILIRYEMFDKWLQLDLSPILQQKLKFYFHHYVQRRFSYGGYGVFELLTVAPS